jgi:hypothetical protein
MKKVRSAKDPLASDQRTNIRMSKIARELQSAAAKTKWEDMVKLLYRADPFSGRNDVIRKMIFEDKYSQNTASDRSSYSMDQLQYALFLMLIISVAEKRTQELYGHEFAQRCEDISREHRLRDNEYWTIGQVPAEWKALDHEFEQNSLRILLETLRAYHQNEIADLVETGGLEQLFDIIKTIKFQFAKVLSHATPGTSYQLGQAGAVPETLQSSRRIKRNEASDDTK